jgi:hypothetical protein
MNLNILVTGISADGHHIGSRDVIVIVEEEIGVHVLGQVHPPGVHLEDLEQGLFGRNWDFDRTIDPAGPDQSRIQGPWSICGKYDGDLYPRIKSVLKQILKANCH